MFHGINERGWGMGWNWIIGLILLVAVICIIVILVNRNNQSQGFNKSHLDVLKESYTKGEIDKKEFEEHKKNL